MVNNVKMGPKSFSTIPNSSNSRKYVLIRLTSAIGGQGNIKRLLR